MNGSYTTSTGVYGTVQSGGAPSYIKGDCKLYLNAGYVSNIVKHEWSLRGGAPNGTRIENSNYNSVTVVIGNVSYGWVVLDYIGTESNGKKHYGFYYFSIQNR